MKVAIQKTTNVQDPTWAHDTAAGLDLYIPEGQSCLGPVPGGSQRHPHSRNIMNSKDKTMDERAHLTVNGLMCELQGIARRYGNIPVVVLTTADADYEQATARFIMHARRQPVPADWDLFHVAPNGEAVAVIS